MLRFFVHGMPATAGSKRAHAIWRKGDPTSGETGRVFTGKVVVRDDAEQRGKPWRASVQSFALEARAAMADRAEAAAFLVAQMPLRIKITFVLPRPASASYRRRPFPVVRPDVDKLSRAVLDALKHVLWNDDVQVVTKTVRKRYQESAVPDRRDVGAWITLEVEPAEQAGIL